MGNGTTRKTRGISPKVWLPVSAQATALLVNLIASGHFDRVELSQLAALGLTAFFGYLANPGQVE